MAIKLNLKVSDNNYHKIPKYHGASAGLRIHTAHESVDTTFANGVQADTETEGSCEPSLRREY